MFRVPTPKYIFWSLSILIEHHTRCASALNTYLVRYIYHCCYIIFTLHVSVTAVISSGLHSILIYYYGYNFCLHFILICHYYHILFSSLHTYMSLHVFILVSTAYLSVIAVHSLCLQIHTYRSQYYNLFVFRFILIRHSCYILLSSLYAYLSLLLYYLVSSPYLSLTVVISSGLHSKIAYMPFLFRHLVSAQYLTAFVFTHH